MAETTNLGESLNIQGTEPVAAEQTKTKKGPDKGGFYWGTGRRKSSVARVRIRPGSGKVEVNKKEMTEYFKLEQHRQAVIGPLKAIGSENKFDVFVNVNGGGITGQAGATVMGLARALDAYDESLGVAMRDGGFMTRDSRMVERKKPGKAGARKSFQFSKR